MPKFDVFLSHNSVDKPWVINLKNDLCQYGLSVWLDKDEIRPGDLFGKSLEDGLENSKSIALIVSPESMASGWVEAEYYRALSLSQNKNIRLQLIPVVLRTATLPGFAQDRSYISFQDESAYVLNVWKLVWGITGIKPDKVLDLNRKDFSSLNNNDPDKKNEEKPNNNVLSTEIPQAPFGTMPPESSYYINREADDICRNCLSQEFATTIYIQASRQMGKSSLLRRMAKITETRSSIKTVYIDFEKFTDSQLENEEDFLVELCLMIGDSLNIPEKIEQYWSNRKRSNIIKCSNYLSQHISSSYGKPIILAMDEMERILTKSLCNDFFGMLRTWHNDRSWDVNFKRITLLLSSSTEPDLFIDNPNQSPFNVAEKILLKDFNYNEIEELNKRYKNPLSEGQIKELMGLLNGHPFLTHLAIYLLAIKRTNFEGLLANASSDTGPFGDHLRRYWQNIISMPEIKQRLFEIIHLHNDNEDRLYFRLKGAGLISKENSTITMRNSLYKTYFTEKLNG